MVSSELAYRYEIHHKYQYTIQGVLNVIAICTYRVNDRVFLLVFRIRTLSKQNDASASLYFSRLVIVTVIIGYSMSCIHFKSILCS